MKILSCLLLLLAACSTTRDAVNRIGERYYNRQADEFFMQYGPPASQYKLNSGGVIYTWHSGVNNVPVGNAVSTTIGQANQYGFTSTTVTTPPGNIALWCEVRLYTNEDGYIRNVEARGTTGFWETSRCAELFK